MYYLQETLGHDDRDLRAFVVGGRVLQLVVSLCDDWGVDQSGTGKSVWARLPVPASWPHAAACGCAAGELRLSSGRTVAPR